MKNMLFLLLPTLYILPSHAQDMKRDNITSCAYQAGTAYEVQNIRQIEGDNWQQFEDNIVAIYAKSQGRTDLLTIAKRVFLHPTDTSKEAVHDEIFNACIARQHGTEPTT